MEILTQLGLTGVEAGLGVAVIGLGVVLAVVVLRNQSKASDGQQSHLAFLVESLSSMKEDQTKLRGQIENMTKVQETVRAQMSDQLQSQEREIRKALEERLADVTHRVGENLQKTTEKTSESLTDLQKRLAVIDAAQKTLPICRRISSACRTSSLTNRPAVPSAKCRWKTLSGTCCQRTTLNLKQLYRITNGSTA